LPSYQVKKEAVSASRNQSLSFSEFKTLPQLPGGGLSEILKSRFSVTARRAKYRIGEEEVGYSTTSRVKAPEVDPQFQEALNIAFKTWMASHGQDIVEDAVQRAVEKAMAEGMRERIVKKEKRFEDESEIKDSQEDMVSFLAQQYSCDCDF
jgi:hypothetical protein